MRKHLISFAQVTKICKISSSSWGVYLNTPLAYTLDVKYGFYAKIASEQGRS